MNIYKLNFDGSCSINPGGRACYGFTLEKNGELLSEGHGVIGEGPAMSNNVAEFEALRQGLLKFMDTFSGGPAILLVHGDSKMVLGMSTRMSKGTKNCLYYPYWIECKAVISQARKLCPIQFEYVPREYNTKCDDLSKKDQNNS